MTRTRLHSLTTHLAATLLLCVAGAQAGAADWQKVLSDRNRVVEIDRAAIFASDGGTKVSWGRMVMSEAAGATVGYRTVKALNRYDCRNRSFVTIKRVYLDASDRVIREETKPEQVPVMVTRNTADERMWREVCRPPGSATLGSIAAAASKAAASATTAGTSVAPAADPPRASKLMPDDPRNRAGRADKSTDRSAPTAP